MNIINKKNHQVLVPNYLFLDPFRNFFGHHFNFSTLQSFISHFFRKYLVFIHQKLFNKHDFDRLISFNQKFYGSLHDIEETMEARSNIMINSNTYLNSINQKQSQYNESRENFGIINATTKELDKERGARTTSIKTLPTLVPLVMCFNCCDIRIKPSVIPQLKKMEKSKKEKLQSFHEEVNINNV
jgi:hypothetical protein